MNERALLDECRNRVECPGSLHLSSCPEKNYVGLMRVRRRGPWHRLLIWIGRR